MKITADAVKDFIQKNTKLVAAGAVALVLIAAIIVFVVVKNGGKTEETEAEAPVVNVEEGQENSAAEVKDVPLETSKSPEINALVEQYFAAMTSGDVDALIAIAGDISAEDQIRIREKANYIEGYQDITVYTKPGPADKSWIAFAEYNIKFKDVETAAPGLTSFYIVTKDDGSLRAYSGSKAAMEELDQDVYDYIQTVAQQEDVVELLTKVDTKYSQVEAEDNKLSTMINDLNVKLDVAVENAAAQEAEAAKAAEEAQAADVAQTPANETVKAIDNVNIRKSASEEGEKLGKAEIGATFTRLQTMDNGWSKIDYNGTEAYIKSEFLEAVAAGAEAGGEGVASETGAQNEPPQTAEEPARAEEPQQTSNDSPSSGAGRVKETVNVRKSANENGEKLGVAYQGDEVEIVMKQADGWTKIKYKGETAYVKSEYLE